MTLGQLERMLRAAVRRFRVAASTGGLWSLSGHGQERAEEVELFGGIGFHSRPGSSGKPEVVVVKVGAASGHPVIIATRDEATRVTLEADETAIFNSTTIVKIKADGTIEAGSRGGTFEALLKKSEYDALKTVFDAHTHAGVTTGAGVSGTTATPAPTATGTTKLKGE